MRKPTKNAPKKRSVPTKKSPPVAEANTGGSAGTAQDDIEITALALAPGEALA